jgi:hypothetical protein
MHDRLLAPPQRSMFVSTDTAHTASSPAMNSALQARGTSDARKGVLFMRGARVARRRARAKVHTHTWAADITA